MRPSGGPRAVLVLLALLLLLLAVAAPASAQQFPVIRRFSRNPNNATSHTLASLSVSSGADAVTFISDADLADEGTEGVRHVFLYEKTPQTLSLVTPASESASPRASRPRARIARGAGGIRAEQGRGSLPATLF